MIRLFMRTVGEKVANNCYLICLRQFYKWYAEQTEGKTHPMARVQSNGFGSHISLLSLCSNRNSGKSLSIHVDADVVFSPMRRNALISQRNSRYVSDSLLVVPIQFFLNRYDLRRAAMTIWVVGRFATAWLNRIAHFAVGILLLNHYGSDLAHISYLYSLVIGLYKSWIWEKIIKK